MTRSILAGATLLLAVGASPQAFAQYGYDNGYDNATVVRCESTDDRQRFCQADTSGGVRLSRQLSESRCIEGQSWGSDHRGIWVDRGCRAEFVVQRASAGGYPGGGDPGNGYPGNGYPGNGNGNTFRCESTDGRWRQCDLGGRRAEFVRQLSDRPCVHGRTWDNDHHGVWVSGGCRAEFRMTGRGVGNGWGNAQPQLVRCESSDGRQRTCPVNTRGGVRLVRQLSRTPCVEGQSWGRSRDSIWVARGCRGEFETGGRRGDRRYGDDG